MFADKYNEGCNDLAKPYPWLGKPSPVLANAATHAADDFLHGAASGKRRSGLGKSDALLSHHAPRLGLSSTPAPRELQHPQGHDGLSLIPKPCGIESKFHPGSEHGLRIRGLSGANARVWATRQTEIGKRALVRTF